jgi:hypothetical protein
MRRQLRGGEPAPNRRASASGARASFHGRFALRQSVGRRAQDYIVDALTDELTTSMARFPSSVVIARNTAFTFKGEPIDAKAIGKDQKPREEAAANTL